MLLAMDEPAPPLHREIHIRGLLGETLLAGFPGLDATYRDGETLLSGLLPDQAALYGVLAQIEALGLELLEVRRVAPSTGANQPDRLTTAHPGRREASC
jgi:hypothetical protein